MNATSVDLREFLLASHAILDRLEPRLARGEKDQDQEKRWQDAWALVRGLREDGSALGLGRLDHLARRAEGVLSRLAKSLVLPQPPVIGFLLDLAGELRRDLYDLESRGSEIGPDGMATPPGGPLPEKNIPAFQPLPWLRKNLLFRTPDDGRMLVPFEHVMRVEAFGESSVEKGAEFDSLRRQDRLVPLLDVSGLLPERRVVFRRPPVSTPPGQSRQVIVYVTPEGEVGLVVDAVLDVLKARVQIERPASRPGVMGSMTLEDRITELLDVPVLLAKSGIAVPLQVA